MSIDCQTGGPIANIVVHGKSMPLQMDKLWERNIKLTIRLTGTITIPKLFKIIQPGKVHPQRLITHHFKLDEIMLAFDTFENGTKKRALKFIVEMFSFIVLKCRNLFGRKAEVLSP